MTEIINGTARPAADPSVEAACGVLAKALSEAKRGEWSFAAVVLVDKTGNAHVDFQGAVKLMPTANLATDHLKDRLIAQYMGECAKPARIVPAASVATSGRA